MVARLVWIICFQAAPKAARKATEAVERKAEKMDAVSKVMGWIFLGVVALAVLLAAIGVVIWSAKPAAPTYIYSDSTQPPTIPPRPAHVPTPNDPWIPNPNYQPPIPNRRPGSLGSEKGSLEDLKGAKDSGKDAGKK